VHLAQTDGVQQAVDVVGVVLLNSNVSTSDRVDAINREIVIIIGLTDTGTLGIGLPLEAFFCVNQLSMVRQSLPVPVPALLFISSSDHELDEGHCVGSLKIYVEPRRVVAWHCVHAVGGSAGLTHVGQVEVAVITVDSSAWQVVRGLSPTQTIDVMGRTRPLRAL
jgi:hypothetical protein